MPQPVTFQNGGGPIDRWTIQPDLPTGLTMDAATGRITGTPSVNSSRVTYIITAYNDGGSDIQTLNITVREPAPQLLEDIGIFGINHTRSEAFAPILIQNLVALSDMDDRTFIAAWTYLRPRSPDDPRCPILER